MITMRKATAKQVQTLSKKLLKLLDDENSQIYRDNVTKFGIPKEYVQKAFSEETLLEAFTSGKSSYYTALENGCKILGFAQTVKQDSDTAELDRIIIFPEHARKGIGTKLLNKALKDQRKSGIHTIIVNAGKEETHARKFYEKNGFKQVKETIIDTPWGKKLCLVTYQLTLK